MKMFIIFFVMMFLIIISLILYFKGIDPVNTVKNIVEPILPKDPLIASLIYGMIFLIVFAFGIMTLFKE